MNIDYDNLRAETEDRIIGLQELQRLVDQTDHYIQKLHEVGHFIEQLHIAFGNLDSEGRRAVPEQMRSALDGLGETEKHYFGLLDQTNPSPMSQYRLGLVVIARLNEAAKTK